MSYNCDICNRTVWSPSVGKPWCQPCKREFKAVFPPLSARERINLTNRENYHRNKDAINARRRANYRKKVLGEVRPYKK